MTEHPVCRWCRRRLPEKKGPGRPREFCGGSCRQQDYLRRQRAADAGLAEHELVVTRGELDDLHDKLYVLEAAVEDVDRDLADGGDGQGLRGGRGLAAGSGPAPPGRPPRRPA